jgi:hypothetical protein
VSEQPPNKLPEKDPNAPLGYRPDGKAYVKGPYRKKKRAKRNPRVGALSNYGTRGYGKLLREMEKAPALSPEIREAKNADLEPLARSIKKKEFGKQEQQRNRARIANLLAKGANKLQIAIALYIDLRTVEREIKLIGAVWREECAHSFEDYRAIHAQNLSVLKQEAWHGYENSGGVRTKKIKSKINCEGPSQTQTIEEYVPKDRGYLELILKISESERKLFGIDAPTRTQITAAVTDIPAEMRDTPDRARILEQIYGQQKILEIAKPGTPETVSPNESGD